MPANNEMLSWGDVQAEVDAGRMQWTTVQSGTRVATRSAWKTNVDNDGALTSDAKLCRYDEMLAHAVTTPPYYDVVLADNPFSYYHLDETATGDLAVVQDATANNRDAKVIGTQITGQQSPLIAQASNTYSFSRSGDIGAVQYDAANITYPFSLEGWFYLTNTSGSRYFFWHDIATFQYNGTLYVYTISNNTSYNTGVSIATNTVYHVVFVYDYTNSIIRVYLNGTEVWNRAYSVTTSEYVTFGARYDGYYGIVGRMDELAIYDRALTATEITDHYNAGT